MIPLHLALKRLATIIPAVGLLLLVSVNPMAQSTKLPEPTGYVSDLAGVMDVEAKSRLESFLDKLKDKSKLGLYVVIVGSTGDQEVSAFSKQLARDWNIGAQGARNKSLLLVVSADSKTSFTQVSRLAQADLPEGVLGEMSYRMQKPLQDGLLTEAVDKGVKVFANALAEKIGFNVSEIETTPVVATSDPTDSPQSTLVSAQDSQKTRPRVVNETKPESQATPPVDTPEAAPRRSETPIDEPVTTDPPATEPTPAEPTEGEVNEAGTEKSKPATKKPASAKTNTAVAKKPETRTPEELAELELDESEEVELTLTKPLPERAIKLKEFLETHPDSKSRPRAIELLISTHAGLGDQKLKNGDLAGGIEQMMRAIDEADVNISEKLFAGVIAQIPMNLYLRGERAAAFKAAQEIETKFGSDPKRLLEVAGFYLGIERANETVRLAESAVKLAPDLAEAHRVLAVGLHLSLRLDEAVAEYKKTVELDPSSKVSRGSLADLYRAAGKTEEALALYDEQLTADPKNKPALAGKVVSLFELGRTDEANSTLQAAIARDPVNLPLLTGAAYWLAAHENYEGAFALAGRAIGIEPRYTWAQIALAHAYLGLQRPLDAERAIRFARQYGKFPTLNYELASILSSMGLYDEASEVLRQSFSINDGQIQTLLAGHVPASEKNFIDLIAPERRAGIYQPKAADNATNAQILKSLLALNTALAPGDGEKINEKAAVAAAKDFTAGTDGMRAFRQLYAANRLLRNGIGMTTSLGFIADARNALDDALKVPGLALAAQAEEFRDLRALSISTGTVPDIAPAPTEALATILKGKLEDLEGWALFNQENYSDAVLHLRKATEMLPAETPSWRGALWHLGASLEQAGQKEEALDAYIKSYRSGPSEAVRRSLIEQLYKKIHGSLDGLEDRIGFGTAARNGQLSSPAAEPPVAPATEISTPVETPRPESESTTAPDETPKAESDAPASPASTEPPSPISDESLRSAASRLRSNIKITGRILDSDKVGIANVVVVLISPSGTVLAATTDNEGSYSFKVAPSQKTYRVIPSKEGLSFTPIDRTLPGLFEDLKIDFVGTRP